MIRGAYVGGKETLLSPSAEIPRAYNSYEHYLVPG
jgi:hypothetical protein